MRPVRAYLAIVLFLGIQVVTAVGQTNGTVSGKVILSGIPPKSLVIDMSKEPECVKLNPKQRTTEDTVTGPANALKNVVVFISAGAPPASAPQARPVTLNQQNCHYTTRVLASVRCNIHSWMRAYFAVMPTSHFAVTGEEGQFTLPELTPGKYTVTAWHETYGTRNQEVTIVPGQQLTVDFTYNAKTR